MTIKKKITVSLAALAAVAALSAGIASSVVLADEGTLSEVSYKTQYLMNETLALQDATIAYGGKNYDATAILHYPNGKTCALETAVLTEQGEYTVEYKALVENKAISKTVKFTVLGDRYGFEGSGSVSYGATPYLEGYEGLNVSLDRNSTFVYNQVIDVSDNTYAADVIRFYVTPSIVGEREVSAIFVRLTDAYDPDNYIVVRYRHVPNADNWTYISAGANGQPSTGVSPTNTPGADTVEFEGKLYRMWQNHQYYGHGMASSFTGLCPGNYNVEHDKIGWTFARNYQRFALDYESKKVHAQAVDETSREATLVTDLDDDVFFEGNLWQGFTTGEVILSMYAEGYQGAAFNFFVTTIDGQPVASDGVVNTIAPLVEVDFGEGLSQETLPQAIVGRPYNVFNATARDEYEGEVPCNALVWYNYNNSARTLVSVNDGKFIPTRKGTYTIEYTATDSFGNKGRRLVEIEAIERDKLVYTFGESEKTFDVASNVSVSTLTVENGTVGASVNVRAKLKGGDTVYPIDNQKLTFRPLYAGTYVIEYEYSDYIETQVFSYEITVNSVSKPLFVDDIVLPRYFIKDCEYYIPDYYGYDFSEGTKQIKAEISLKVGQGEKAALANNAFKATTMDSVEVTYKLTGAAGTDEKTLLVPVVNTGYNKLGSLDLSQYLQGEAFAAAASNSDIAYTTNAVKATGGKAVLSLINAGYWNVFSTEFTVDTTAKNYNSVTLRFTDVEEHDNKMEISFTRSGNNTAVKLICGDRVLESVIEKSFEGVTFRTAVDNGSFIVADSDISLPAEELLSGFSKKFYTDIELGGVSGEATIHMKRLMNQQLSNMNADMVKPVLIFTEFKNAYDLGDSVAIKGFDTYDFVDPSPSLSYYVTNAQGQYVTSSEGVSMNGTQDVRGTYTIKCDTYVNCILSGEVVDYSRRKEAFSFVFSVTDKVAPTLTLSNAKTSGKVGSKITLASYTAEDDKTANVSVYIQICDPTGKCTMYEDIKEFTPTMSGRYRIMYCAMDEASNITFAEYYITVA